MKKRNILILFFIILIYNLFICELTLDDVWTFGFSYNIASGLVPYRDFNMVITPFFPMLMAFFLNVFSKQLIVLYIVNSFLLVGIVYLAKKFCKDSCYLIFVLPLFLQISCINYSMFCLFLLLVILDCEVNKKSDYAIGLLLAITVLTKQNVGLMLLIPSLLFSRNHQLFKRLVGFSIPIIIFLVYLVVTNSWSAFLNYAVLGLFDFAGSNTLISPIMVIEAIIIMYLIHKVIRNRKDIFLIYIFFFQIITYPLFDRYHFMLGFIAFLIYLFKDFNLDQKAVKVSAYIMIIFVFIYGISIQDFKQIEYPNHSKTMKYKVVDKRIFNEVDNISNYIKKNNIDNLYLFNSWAYLIKLESGIKINQYDLINNGNLGYKGTDKVLKEIKASKKGTTFIINEQELKENRQINKTIVTYVMNNMKKTKDIGMFSIYVK